MALAALIAALLLEQLRPLRHGNPAQRAVRAVSAWIESATNAGEARHGALGWLVLVGGACSLTLAAGWLLARMHPVAAFALHVAVLYCTVGFRQFPRTFADAQVALDAGDTERARALIERWLLGADGELSTGALSTGTLSTGELCRQAISHALIAAHRHVFAPVLWYVLLPGVAGPVLYRMAEHLARRWREQPLGVVPGPQTQAYATEPYGRFAQRAYWMLDWLPLRLTAAGFAVVGDFDNAVYCWRGASAVPSPDAQRSVLLGAGGGALGLRLADARLEGQWAAGPTGFDWAGAEPDSAALRSTVGVVWRATVLWVSVLGLLTVASWLG